MDCRTEEFCLAMIKTFKKGWARNKMNKKLILLKTDKNNPNFGRFYNMIVELKKLDKKLNHQDWSERSKELEQDLSIHLLGEMIDQKADKVSDIEEKLKAMKKDIPPARGYHT